MTYEEALEWFRAHDGKVTLGFSVTTFTVNWYRVLADPNRSIKTALPEAVEALKKKLLGQGNPSRQRGGWVVGANQSPATSK
jgi:hypothetical protein